jgi:hypothetical protein
MINKINIWGRINMGLTFNVYVGSGQATCKLCNQRIKKNEFQINASGYQVSGSIHLKCAKDIANNLLKDDNIRNKMIFDSL